MKSMVPRLLVALVASTLLFPAIGTADGPIAGPVPDARIVIFKEQRLLQLFSGDDLVREYHIGLGFEPVADKRREGDGATPEGSYRICIKNPQSQFYLSLGLDYPNLSDAVVGRQEGVISPSEENAIAEAIQHQHCPPWNTALGGEIFIHGRGSSSDWTLGCVALDDEDMQELYDAVNVGTNVEIQP